MDQKTIAIKGTSRGSVVTKANSLIEASYTLTLNEQRIILACAAKLDGRKPMPRETAFVLTAEEFCELFETDPASAYSELKDAANRLYERDISRIDGKSRTRLRWVYMAHYQDGEGLVRIAFSPEIAPYLTLLHKQFTSYRLEEVAMLGTAYAIRLYEMLAQFNSTGVFSIAVADFKARYGLTEKYARFANLKARVIQPAVQELNDKTSFAVTWKGIKTGKTVERLEFRFTEKAATAV